MRPYTQGGVGEPAKLDAQLAAVRVMDLDKLAERMGNAVYDAAVAGRDTPTPEEAIGGGGGGDAGANNPEVRRCRLNTTACRPRVLKHAYVSTP